MFKDQLKKLRKKNHLTQEELADRLFVSRTLVAKWETGKRYPSKDALTEMASLFTVSYDELIDGSSEPIDAGNELSECVPGTESADKEYNEILVALLSRRISEFLRQLPETDRNIFVRRYYFYDKAEEIAENYGLSADEVRAKLQEIRSMLLNLLVKENY